MITKMKGRTIPMIDRLGNLIAELAVGFPRNFRVAGGRHVDWIAGDWFQDPWWQDQDETESDPGNRAANNIGRDVQETKSGKRSQPSVGSFLFRRTGESIENVFDDRNPFVFFRQLQSSSFNTRIHVADLGLSLFGSL